MVAAVGEAGDQGVEEHVGGAGVESENLRGSGVGGDDGDVGDAAEIERDTAEFGVAIEEIVGEGNERRALAADGDVRGTKIGDGGDAGAGGDDGGFADLQRGGGGMAEEGDGTALVEDGLAVAADEGDAGCGDAELAESGEGGFGEGVPETEIELRDLRGRGGSAFGDAQDLGAKSGGKRTGGVGQKLGMGGGDLDQSYVDGVGGGAGH